MIWFVGFEKQLDKLERFPTLSILTSDFDPRRGTTGPIKIYNHFFSVLTGQTLIITQS